MICIYEKNIQIGGLSIKKVFFLVSYSEKALSWGAPWLSAVMTAWLKVALDIEAVSGLECTEYSFAKKTCLVYAEASCRLASSLVGRW